MKNGKLRDRMKVILAVICVLAAGICYIGSRYVRPEENRVREERFVLDTEEEDTFLTDEGDTRKQDDSMSENRMDRDAGVGSQDSGKTQQPCGEETKTQGSSKAREESVFVHVCGEVVFPGVYEMPAGSRVYEAVEMAGGCTENGAADYLNMAQEVSDGMKIQVPDREEAKRLSEQQPGLGAGISGGQTAGTGSGQGQAAGQVKVNINTASRGELMTLTGIGQARADDIIRYRQEHGSFKRIEDIMKVSGIKEAAFQKIKDSITV